jgi:hypothetical protein
MKEAYLFQTLKQGVPEAHWTRIETVVGAGVPDLHGCWEGRDAWIELKMFHGNRISVRTSQVSWHTNRLLHGGMAHFLARRGDELWLLRSNVLVNLAKNPQYAKTSGSDGKSIEIDIPRMAATKIFRKPFPWTEVRDALFGV